jgi:hypothetical protein
VKHSALRFPARQFTLNGASPTVWFRPTELAKLLRGMTLDALAETTADGDTRRFIGRSGIPGVGALVRVTNIADDDEGNTVADISILLPKATAGDQDVWISMGQRRMITSERAFASVDDAREIAGTCY